MNDTLTIVRGADNGKALANRNRERLGLMPHAAGLEKFLADQDRARRDPNRKIIGYAATRYRLYPAAEE